MEASDTEPPSEEGRSEEERVAEEADAAAAEAGAIGGRVSYEEEDPAERPLDEAGEGEAEGFELAEEDLIEHASHGDPAPDPSEEEQILREAEGDEAEHGSADHEHSSERRDEEQTH
jgi:hypothetical protein